MVHRGPGQRPCCLPVKLPACGSDDSSTGLVLMPFVVEIFGYFRAAEEQPVKAQHDDQKSQHLHR
jgi:hypothetical protein